MLAQLSNSNGSSGTWTFIQRIISRLTLSFNSSGTLTGMSDQTGDSITSLSYTGSSCPRGDTCTEWSEPSEAATLVVPEVEVQGQLQVASVFGLNSGITATFSI